MWASQIEIDTYFRTVVAPDCPNCGANPCYLLCPCSPGYYSAEREMQDSLYEDSLSQSEWMSLAVAQYEAVHGEAYCS